MSPGQPAPPARGAGRVPAAALAFALALAPAAVPAGAGGEAPVPVRQGRQWGYADRAGKTVVPPAYDRARPFSDGVARVARDERWGLIDAAGNAVVPPTYALLGPFSEGLAPACRDTGVPTGVTEGVGRQRRPVTALACGFVDPRGRVAVPFAYSWVNGFADGVAQVKRDRPGPCLVPAAWGLVDREGRELIPVAHCFVGPPSEGLVKVVFEELSLEVRRFGYHDLAGRPVLPRLPYDGGHERWSEGRLGVRRGALFGFIDREGREVVPLRFTSAYPYSEGLAAVQLADRWGFVDRTGALAIAADYDEVESFADGLAWARRGESAGFLDRDGRIAIPFAFDGWVDREGRPGWSEGRRGMKAKGGGWGFVDRTGRWVVPPEYRRVRPCSEGLCAVEKDGLWGFVDTAGRLAIPLRYQRIESTFDGGLAEVSRRLRKDLPHFASGFIDRTGREFFDEPPLF